MLLLRSEAPAALTVGEGARPFLLGDPGQDGQAVELAQLLLASQTRVERVHREGAADAEDEAREESGGKGQRRTRRERRGRSGRAGLQPQRGIARLADALQPHELCAELLGVIAARLPRRDLLPQAREHPVDFCAQLLGPLGDGLRGEPVGQVPGQGGRVGLRLHRDDVALRDRLGRDRGEQLAHALLETQLALHPHRHITVLHEPGDRLHVSRRIARLLDHRQPRERGVVLCGGRHQKVRLGAIPVLGHRQVERRDEQRQERHPGDERETLA